MTQIYRVSFFKNLVDSYGHPVDACQGVVEVRAPSEDRALELARQRFAKLKYVRSWSLRADYEKVELLLRFDEQSYTRPAVQLASKMLR